MTYRDVRYEYIEGEGEKFLQNQRAPNSSLALRHRGSEIQIQMDGWMDGESELVWVGMGPRTTKNRRLALGWLKPVSETSIALPPCLGSANARAGLATLFLGRVSSPLIPELNHE